MNYPRSCGILLHLTCLPGRHGIGDLGPAAFHFAEMLARAGQTWWQILPLGDADCPYQCISAMAGNPNLLSPELLAQEGLTTLDDLEHPEFPLDSIDFSRVSAFKHAVIARAWDRFQGGAASHLHGDFEAFREAEAGWLDDFSLFRALKSRYPGQPWADWPAAIVSRNKSALREARSVLADDIERTKFSQFLFFRQLGALRKHAAGLGVKLIGDLPIFVSGESADVWANPHHFQLDKNRRPKAVAGVPPDYFSTTGQRWGNPLYNWSAMKRDGFRWWIDRARMALRQADVVRIDHFRGFAASWTIPASEPTAERGKWVATPGVELFTTLREALGGLPFIAEDLGVITPDVEALRDRFGLPGMRVLQFGFGGDANNTFLPHNFIHNCIAYTATHDNDTTIGWQKSLGRKERAHLRQYAPEAAGDPAGALMRLAWASVADVAITPLQDLLGLGSEARMNTPGTCSGNWGWRFRKEMLSRRILAQLREMTETYGRMKKYAIRK